MLSTTSGSSVILPAIVFHLRHHVKPAQAQARAWRGRLGLGWWLQTLSCALSNPREIVIVGDPDSADTQALLNVVRDGYQPFQVMALGVPSIQPPAIPLLQDRGLVDGRAAAYVCGNFVCQALATGPEGLRALLGSG